MMNCIYQPSFGTEIYVLRCLYLKVLAAKLRNTAERYVHESVLFVSFAYLEFSFFQCRSHGFLHCLTFSKFVLMQFLEIIVFRVVMASAILSRRPLRLGLSDHITIKFLPWHHETHLMILQSFEIYFLDHVFSLMICLDH